MSSTATRSFARVTQVISDQPAVVRAAVPAAFAVADLAAHVLSILEADCVVLTRDGVAALDERVAASVGAHPVTGQDVRLLERHEAQMAADERRRQELRGRPRGRHARTHMWWSSRIRRPGRDMAGALHVRTASSWELTTSRQRMLAMFSVRFGELLEPDARPHFSDSERLQVARKLSELAVSANSYEDLMGGITAVLGPLFNVTKTGIGVWHGDSHYLQLLTGSFGSDAAMAASSQIRGSDPRSGAERVRQTGKPYYTNNLELGIPRYAPWLRHMGVNRLMTVPIPVQGQIQGVLHIANKRTDFVDEDMEKAAEIVPFVAAAMESVRHRVQTRRNEALAAVVTRAGTAVAMGEPLTNFRATVLDEFCTTVGASLLAIASETNAPIVLRGGPVDPELERAFLAASGHGGTALRTATRRPRAALDPGWSALHAPVMIGGQREATFSLLRIPCEAFSKDEMAAIRRMANITALAWVTARFHQERLDAARMRERQRIADDLHDHVAQILFSGQLTIESILEEFDDDASLLPAVGRARDLLARGQTSIREVIHHLASPAPGGIVPGLTSLAENVMTEFGVKISASARGRVASDEQLIPAAVTEILLRATREATVNAAKHAPGCEVWIEAHLRRNRVVVNVDDNGPGMPVKRGIEGYGLRAMRRNLAEIGGILRIGRSARGGTRYLISVPLTDQ